MNDTKKIMDSIASRLPVSLDMQPGSVIRTLVEIFAAEIADLEYRMCKQFKPLATSTAKELNRQSLIQDKVAKGLPLSLEDLALLRNDLEETIPVPDPEPSMKPPYKEKAW